MAGRLKPPPARTPVNGRGGVGVGRSGTRHKCPGLRPPSAERGVNAPGVTAGTADQRTVLERQIAATDRQIDRLVYELYDLTDEEIAMVEADQAQKKTSALVANVGPGMRSPVGFHCSSEFQPGCR